MTNILLFTYIIIFAALVFDFLNGFHDAANSVATVVSTGLLKPFWAVFWVAFFNFIAFIFFHLSVASTLGKGLVSLGDVTPFVIFSALIAAIFFNLVTWFFGLPSSSSHALIGGLVGAAVAQAGWDSLEITGLITVLIALILSPILGVIIAWILISILRKIHYKKSPTVQKWIERLHLLSAALLSLGHGGNDAQKTMGIIASLLFSVKLLGPHFYIPWWVVITCNLVMGLGTAAGGWRIIKTLSEKITKLDPINGSAAQISSAGIIFAATYMGIPISTTHTVTGSIIGVGIHKGIRHTQWNTVSRIVFAWVLTLPITALIGGLLVHIRGLM